jgi:hypothetical protein
MLPIASNEARVRGLFRFWQLPAGLVTTQYARVMTSWVRLIDDHGQRRHRA